MWSVLYIFSQVDSIKLNFIIGTDLLQVSSLLMLYPLANLANLLMWGLTFLGATWAYAKYRYAEVNLPDAVESKLEFPSGEFSGVGVQIEELTGKVWDNCFQPILSKVSPFYSVNICLILRGFVLVGAVST